MICLYSSSPFFSMILASEVRFLLPTSFILAHFHIYEPQREATGELDPWTAAVSKWNPKLCTQARGDLSEPRGYTQPLFKTLNIACCLQEYLKTWPTCAAADLWGGSGSHMFCSTPAMVPFLNSHHCDPGEHVLWLLQAWRKTCRMLWSVAMTTVST